MYITYKYEPDLPKIYYADTLDDSIKPGDMAVVNSFSRFKMCIVQVEEVGVMVPSDLKKKWGAEGKMFHCYGVFDQSKWNEAVEREEIISRNLSR